MKCVTVKFLGIKVPSTYIRVTLFLGCLIIFDCFIWVCLVLWLFNLFYNVWVCVCVRVSVTCVVLVFTVFFVLFRLCIFILICFVCTSIRTTVTE